MRPLKMMMKSTFAAVLLVAAAALGCHGRSSPAQRNQPQYDVVEEGQSGSATSTIAAPGETQPPTTATNTDTTGTFALGTALAPANMPGGAAQGGVMQPQQPAPMTSGMPATPAPAPVPRPTPTVYVTPPPTTTVVTTTTQAPPPPPRQREQKPPPTETTETTETTSTDTAATDTTSTKEKTDTSQPPPPPPTQTDTIGGH